MADILAYIVFGLCAYFAIAIPLAVMIGRLIRYGGIEKPMPREDFAAWADDGRVPAWKTIEDMPGTFAYARAHSGSMKDKQFVAGFPERATLRQSPSEAAI